MELAKDIREHKLGEVRALLHMRGREALQKGVQELDEADDLVIHLRACLLTDQRVIACLSTVRDTLHLAQKECSVLTIS